MNILYIEPYYSGSHKRWIDSYKKYSKHNIKILHLPGNKWKWRMHGGAITLANQLLNLNETIDLILCSDFLNLPVFKSICSKKIKKIPIIMYFHENQLSYPWSPEDKDIDLKRDLHYHYINYTSSLTADFNFFNSKYHLDSYIDSIKKYLKKMPDFNNFESIDLISKKSSVFQSLRIVLKNPQTWVNGLIVGCLYAPTAAFAELWGVSYIHAVYGFKAHVAAAGVGMIFIGWAISSPFSFLSC